jgi:hypothetical protein
MISGCPFFDLTCVTQGPGCFLRELAKLDNKDESLGLSVLKYC